MANRPSRAAVSLVMRLVLGSLVLLAVMATASPAAAEPTQPPTTGPTCVLLLSGPDLLYFLCVDPSDGECPVYSVRVGHEGDTTKTCF